VDVAATVLDRRSKSSSWTPDIISAKLTKIWTKAAHEGKARGSESGKAGSESIATLLRGVLAGEELGNARGELPASIKNKWQIINN
jgi:hypothetical protein